MRLRRSRARQRHLRTIEDRMTELEVGVKIPW